MKIVREKIVRKITDKQLSSFEAQIARSVYISCFGLKKNEKVLVLADLKKQKEAELLSRAATKYAKEVKEVFFTGMSGNAQEPSRQMIKEMKRAKVALLVTDFSLSHTRGRKEATEAGTRIASMPGITLSMMKRTLIADYEEVARVSQAVAKLLSKAITISIRSKKGTDLTADLKNRRATADTGLLRKLKDFGNLPAGEAFLAPIEESVNGVLVIDAALAEVKLDKSVKVEIKKGKAIKIIGGKGAKEFEKQMKKAGKGADQVAEIGIGTNLKASKTSDILESEKAYATCHVAFGDNYGFGGSNKANFHSDGVIDSPTVKLDGKKIVEKEKILI